MIGCPACALPPRVAETVVTRNAPGTNTAWPRVSVPFWVRPSAASSFSSAVAVAEVNVSEPAGISALVASPSDIRSALSSATSAPVRPEDRVR